MINKSKYIKWYRIAQEAVNNEKLIPQRTDEEIIDLVSRVGWMMFAPKGVQMKEAEQAPEPNIYLRFEGDKLELGLIFNNIGSMDKAKNILSGYCLEEKEKVIKLLLSYDSKWITKLRHKIKDYNWAQKPRYESAMKEFPSNTINDKKIKELFNRAEEIREEGKIKAQSIKAQQNKYYFEGPALTLMVITIEQNEEEFKKRAKEAFPVLDIFLKIKSDKDISRLIKAEEKLKSKKEKALEKAKDCLQFRGFDGCDPDDEEKCRKCPFDWHKFMK